MGSSTPRAAGHNHRNECGEIAQEMGVDIRLNEAVEEFLFEGKTVVGVKTSEGVYHADRFVMNVDFATGMKGLIPDKLWKRWSNKSSTRNPTLAQLTCCILELTSCMICRITKFTQPKITKKICVKFPAMRFHGMTPRSYVQNACITDPSDAPEGHSTIYVLVPVSNQCPEINWDEIA